MATRRTVWSAAAFLILVIVVFAVLRVSEDIPNLTSGRIPPPDDFANRYARHPWIAYLHIVPGLVYLLAAPSQFSASARSRNIERHRRRGRLLLALGLVSGVFALAFGLLFPFGGQVQATATALFGAWFLLSLSLAYRSIRRGDLVEHRQWMIRAFATGLAVGTIRIWVGLFEGFGWLEFRDAFGLSFWLAFALHALAAEVWLRVNPSPAEVATHIRNSSL